MGKGRVMVKRRKKALAIEDPNRDPQPYSGPLRRIDGTAPFNMYLWPMPDDVFVAPDDFAKQIDRHIDRRDTRIAVVALADGRYLTEGFVRNDTDDMMFYPSRRAALRASAADVIRKARNARYDSGNRGRDRMYWEKPPISQADAERLIAWVYSVLDEGAPRYGLMPLEPAHRNCYGQRITPHDRIEVVEMRPGVWGWRTVGGAPGSCTDGGPYSSAQRAKKAAERQANYDARQWGRPLPIVIIDTPKPSRRQVMAEVAGQLSLGF